MASNAVARFRHVFEARLKSGKYEPIDVVQAVKALKTKAELLDALDVYCTLFDPAKPPATRNAFELGRTTGFNLFVRAIELSDAQNELLEAVLSFAAAPPAMLKDARLKQHVAVYRKRYEALDAKDQADLQRRANKEARDRATAASKRRFLLDDLTKEFSNRNGRSAQGQQELLSFDPGPGDTRAEFQRLALGCDAGYFPMHPASGVWAMNQFIPQPGIVTQPTESSTIATQRVEAVFDAFGRYLAREIRQPLDLFRLLAWAREPSPLNTRYEIRGGQAVIREAQSPWSNIWRELYQDIAVRGLVVAVTQWKIEQMIQARGYVGKDLDFILAPLNAAQRELLKRRLAEAFRATQRFAEAQVSRRRAKAWGDLRGLELIDELESEAQLKDLAKELPADIKAVLSRKFSTRTQRTAYQSSYHIFESVKDVFTVVWIPKSTAGNVAYIEVKAIPGFIFRARANWGGGVVRLLQDKAYADLAANAAALTQFLLAYLQILGYALDVITAGASGGLTFVILRFAEERIKDALIAEGLELAGIDNPWVQTLVGLGAGAVPSVFKAPRGLSGLAGELEHDAAKATSGIKGSQTSERAAELEGTIAKETKAPEKGLGKHEAEEVRAEPVSSKSAQTKGKQASKGKEASKGKGLETEEIESGKSKATKNRGTDNPAIQGSGAPSAPAPKRPYHRLETPDDVNAALRDPKIYEISGNARKAGGIANDSDIAELGAAIGKHVKPGRGGAFTLDPAISDALWSLPADLRGVLIERALGASQYKAWFNVGSLERGFFPQVDFSSRPAGSAVADLVSVKSIDPLSKSFGEANQRLAAHIEEIVAGSYNFAGRRGSFLNVTLDVRISSGAAAAGSDLQAALRDLIPRDLRKYVRVDVRPF